MPTLFFFLFIFSKTHYTPSPTFTLILIFSLLSQSRRLLWEVANGYNFSLQLSPKVKSSSSPCGSGLTLGPALPPRMWQKWDCDSEFRLNRFAVSALALLPGLACWRGHMEENQEHPGQWPANYQICRWGCLGPPSPSWPTADRSLMTVPRDQQKNLMSALDFWTTNLLTNNCLS